MDLKFSIESNNQIILRTIISRHSVENSSRTRSSFPSGKHQARILGQRSTNFLPCPRARRARSAASRDHHGRKPSGTGDVKRTGCTTRKINVVIDRSSITTKFHFETEFVWIIAKLRLVYVSFQVAQFSARFLLRREKSAKNGWRSSTWHCYHSTIFSRVIPLLLETLLFLVKLFR